MQVGIRVELLGEQGGLVYEQKAEQAFKPASNQKIVTSAAGLALLPRDFTYHTVLARRGDDLVIIGSGDPAMGDPKMAKAAGEPITQVFDQWADALKAPRSHPGQRRSAFRRFRLRAKAHASRLARAVQPAGLLLRTGGGAQFQRQLRGHRGQAGRQTGRSRGGLAQPRQHVHASAEHHEDRSKGEPLIKRASKDPTLILVSGAVSKANDPDDAVSIAVEDPGLFFASACKAALTAKGIDIHGEDQRRERVRADDLSIPSDVEPLRSTNSDSPT